MVVQTWDIFAAVRWLSQNGCVKNRLNYLYMDMNFEAEVLRDK